MKVDAVCADLGQQVDQLCRPFGRAHFGAKWIACEPTVHRPRVNLSPALGVYIYSSGEFTSPFRDFDSHFGGDYSDQNINFMPGQGAKIFALPSLCCSSCSINACCFLFSSCCCSSCSCSCCRRFLFSLLVHPTLVAPALASVARSSSRCLSSSCCCCFCSNLFFSNASCSSVVLLLLLEQSLLFQLLLQLVLLGSYLLLHFLSADWRFLGLHLVILLNTGHVHIHRSPVLSAEFIKGLVPLLIVPDIFYSRQLSNPRLLYFIFPVIY